MQEALSVILSGPHELQVQRILVPKIPEPAIRVRMKACGICGSDLRYYEGENPWSLHTLGHHIPCPPGVILGHEVSGTVAEKGKERRVGILAFKGCGVCAYCRTSRENLCADVQHIGHASGWPAMPFYPGGMSEEFEVWRGFEHDLPDAVSFEQATFLDGLAVAVHAAERAGLEAGMSVGVVGLGPIGLLASQLAAHRGAARVVGWDTSSLPVQLARESVEGEFHQLENEASMTGAGSAELDCVLDTVGSPASIALAMAALRRGGSLALLAVHEALVPLSTLALSGERRLTTSANNRYPDFAEALRLLASGAIRVGHLITHRFPLAEAVHAFAIMREKEKNSAYKIILAP